MPGCCCYMLLLYNLMDSCKYVRKNTLLTGKGGCICTPLTPLKSPTEFCHSNRLLLLTCTYTHHSCRFGPLRNQWCMRFEAKNAQIKSFVGKNFKNLPYTVAIKHQRYMCLQLNSAPGVEKTNFLYKGDEMGKGMLF